MYSFDNIKSEYNYRRSQLFHWLHNNHLCWPDKFLNFLNCTDKEVRVSWALLYDCLKKKYFKTLLFLKQSWTSAIIFFIYFCITIAYFYRVLIIQSILNIHTVYAYLIDLHCSSVFHIIYFLALALHHHKHKPLSVSWQDPASRQGLESWELRDVPQEWVTLTGCRCVRLSPYCAQWPWGGRSVCVCVCWPGQQSRMHQAASERASERVSVVRGSRSEIAAEYL